MKIKKKNAIALLGMVTTVIAFVLQQVDDWVDEQKTSELIDEKIEKALAEQDKETEDEEES